MKQLIIRTNDKLLSCNNINNVVGWMGGAME